MPHEGFGRKDDLLALPVLDDAVPVVALLADRREDGDIAVAVGELRSRVLPRTGILGKLSRQRALAVAVGYDAIGNARHHRQDIHLEDVARHRPFHLDRAGHDMRPVLREIMRHLRRRDLAGVVQDHGLGNALGREELDGIAPLVLQDTLVRNRVEHHRRTARDGQHGLGGRIGQVAPLDGLERRGHVVDPLRQSRNRDLPRLVAKRLQGHFLGKHLLGSQGPGYHEQAAQQHSLERHSLLPHLRWRG